MSLCNRFFIREAGEFFGRHWPFPIAVAGATFTTEALVNFRHHGVYYSFATRNASLGSPPPFFRRVSGPFFQPSQNKDAKNNTYRNLHDEHQRSPVQCRSSLRANFSPCVCWSAADARFEERMRDCANRIRP